MPETNFPSYEYNPRETKASAEVFDAQDGVEFKIGKGKGFMRKNQDGTLRNYGVGFSLTRADNNKPAYVNFYLHFDRGPAMLKQFQMAALGFKRGKEAEAAFDAQYGDGDWRIDWENGDLGDAWSSITGTRAVCDISINVNKETDDQGNNFNKWRPIGV